VAVGHEGVSAQDVALRRIPVEVARALVHGTSERPADWHPEFPAAGTLDAARMLLGTYEALGQDPGTTPWWFFGVVVDGRVVGDAGFHGPPAADGPAEVEIGYQVAPAFRGRGVATRACALLLEHAWRHGAEVVRADVEPDNPHGSASRAVLRANGFTLTDRGDFAVEAPVTGSA
jgi:RimJ/RimL family protein N-acetyltransferase